MCKIKHIFSVIHYTLCGLYVFSLPFLLQWLREYIYTLSYYHHQIGSVNYNPLFRVRSWNKNVHCMSFYSLNNTYLMDNFMFHHCQFKVPEWLHSSFMRNKDIHDHATRSAQHFLIPCVKTNIGKTGRRYQNGWWRLCLPYISLWKINESVWYSNKSYIQLQIYLKKSKSSVWTVLPICILILCIINIL